MAELLAEAKERLTVPVRGIISDGQLSIRKAVVSVFPSIPISCAIFITYGKRRSRFMRSIVMRKKN